MDENKNPSYQLNFLLDQSKNQQQANYFPSYDSKTTTFNTGVASNMTAWDQQYLQPLAPMNNIALNPITGNYYHAPMPRETFPMAYYITNGENPHAPFQKPTDYLDAGRANQPRDPNWEAISAFLAGHVRPGADVTQVYRCAVCNKEFANPQALGGHMSAHSKARKNKEVLKSTKFTKSAKSKKFKKSTEAKKIKKMKSVVKNEDVQGPP